LGSKNCGYRHGPFPQLVQFRRVSAGAALVREPAVFFIHQIPVLIVALLLVLAWRWEWIGSVLFALLGILYIGMTWRKFWWSAWLAISGPLFLVAALFTANWLSRRRHL